MNLIEALALVVGESSSMHTEVGFIIQPERTIGESGARGMPLARTLAMARHALVLSIAMLCTRFDLATSQTWVPGSQASDIRTIANDTLHDLAVAFADPNNPVIYYNPRLLQRFGPEIAAFVLAHERAHIQLGHRRPRTRMARPALEDLLQSWELAADCIAAAWLARARPSALRAATALFDEMGLGRVDREHPSGIDRAAQLEACGRTLQGDPRRVSVGPHSSVTELRLDNPLF
jgi:putative metallopeptidase-like protein